MDRFWPSCWSFSDHHFGVADHFIVQQVSALDHVDHSALQFFIIGGGKTALDAICWLLDRGADLPLLASVVLHGGMFARAYIVWILAALVLGGVLLGRSFATPERRAALEAGGVADADKKPMDDFRAAYKKKFGIEVQLYAPYVYDSVNVMVAAMQKANSVEPAKYLPELAKIQYKGITGPIVFDAKGDIKDGSLTLFTYKGGKRDLVAVIK